MDILNEIKSYMLCNKASRPISLWPLVVVVEVSPGYSPPMATDCDGKIEVGIEWFTGEQWAEITVLRMRGEVKMQRQGEVLQITFGLSNSDDISGWTFPNSPASFTVFNTSVSGDISGWVLPKRVGDIDA